MGMSGHGTSGWAYAAMGVTVLVLVALVILGITLAAGRRARVSTAVTGPPPGTTPAELLDARLARGEIGEAEYASRRETLAAKAGT